MSDGDVEIDASGNLTTTDAGIAVLHYGQSGNVVISTAAGKTIEAKGGSRTLLPARFPLAALRAFSLIVLSLA